MKKVKCIITALLFFLSLGNAVAQNNSNLPFVGDWKFQQGDLIFKLHIWEDSEPNPYDGEYYLLGHYEMLQQNGNELNLLYTSNPSDVPADQKYQYVFSGLVKNGVFSGMFKEVHPGGAKLNGMFKIVDVLTCLTCPSEINFIVSPLQGMKVEQNGVPPSQNFTVPSDITMVKQ